jgi:hypothetical protein
MAAKPGGEADSEVWRRMKITLLETKKVSDRRGKK